MKPSHVRSRWLTTLIVLTSLLHPASGQGFATSSPMLFPDRSLYIAGEDIRFQSLDPSPGSLLYVELLSPDGHVRASGKYNHDKTASRGRLTLPRGINSGVYVLRAYTRDERSLGQEGFAHALIKVLNPSSTLVSRGSNSATDSLLPLPIGPDPVMIRVDGPGPEFAPRDSLRVQLSGRDMEGCLTLVPAGILPLPPHRLQEYEPGSMDIQYLPDGHGMLLSGSVRSTEPGKVALEEVDVHVSLLGSQGGYRVARSDSLGEFHLSLPLKQGVVELFVQARGPGEEVLELRIDQDFHPDYPAPVLPEFELDSLEREVGLRMAQNLALVAYFQAPIDSLRASPGPVSLPPFYGVPDFRLDMDEFVLLPTLDEVFRNLVPPVRITKRRGEPGLLIESQNPGIHLFPPLVMIDGIPLFDLSLFLSAPTARIRYIDVLTDVFVKGEKRFGGIVNLITRQEDMAGMELPEGGYFLDIQGLSPPDGPLPGNPDQATGMPDLRNTVAWIPDIRLTENAPVDIPLLAPDVPGTYSLLFRGRNAQGSYVETRMDVVIH
ncbi:MAG: hypothetical protein R2751_05615 [Bacteroidales bacterium]